MNRLSDYVTANNHFHAPILLASGSCIVGSDRIGFAQSNGLYIAGVNSVRSKIIPNCICAALRQLEVVIIAADAVSVAFDVHVKGRVHRKDARNLRELLLGARFQRGLIEVEQDVGEAHNEAASGIPSLQNHVQLFSQPITESLRVFLCLNTSLFGL